MRRTLWIVVALILGIAFLGWTALRTPDSNLCYACRRPIHAHSRTVAMVNGHTRQFCCPACALSQREQSGKPVTVQKLTAFLTGRTLAPASAWVVEGSEVNMCARTTEIVDADKRPANLLYDRCSPSLLAFAQRSEALQFAHDHGGHVAAFPDVMAAAQAH